MRTLNTPDAGARFDRNVSMREMRQGNPGRTGSKEGVPDEEDVPQRLRLGTYIRRRVSNLVPSRSRALSQYPPVYSVI